MKNLFLTLILITFSADALARSSGRRGLEEVGRHKGASMHKGMNMEATYTNTLFQYIQSGRLLPGILRQYVENAGVNLNKQNENGDSLFHIWARSDSKQENHKEIYDSFIQLGANDVLLNQKGETPQSLYEARYGAVGSEAPPKRQGFLGTVAKFVPKKDKKLSSSRALSKRPELSKDEAEKKLIQIGEEFISKTEPLLAEEVGIYVNAVRELLHFKADPFILNTNQKTVIENLPHLVQREILNDLSVLNHISFDQQFNRNLEPPAGSMSVEKRQKEVLLLAFHLKDMLSKQEGSKDVFTRDMIDISKSQELAKQNKEKMEDVLHQIFKNIDTFHNLIFYLLKDIGVDFTVKDHSGNTLYHWAFQHNRTADAINFLKKQAPDLNINEVNNSGDAPITLIRQNGAKEELFKGISNLSGINFNVKDVSGELFLVSILKDPAYEHIIRHLIEKTPPIELEAFVSEKDSLDNTVLHTIIRYNEPIAMVLFEKSPYLFKKLENSENVLGLTPFHEISLRSSKLINKIENTKDISEQLSLNHLSPLVVSSLFTQNYEALRPFLKTSETSKAGIYLATSNPSINKKDSFVDLYKRNLGENENEILSSFWKRNTSFGFKRVKKFTNAVDKTTNQPEDVYRAAEKLTSLFGKIFARLDFKQNVAHHLFKSSLPSDTIINLLNYKNIRKFIDKPDQFGKTPFHEAMMNFTSKNAMEKLIDVMRTQKKDLFHTDMYGHSLFTYLSFNPKVEVVEFVLKKLKELKPNHFQINKNNPYVPELYFIFYESPHLVNIKFLLDQIKTTHTPKKRPKINVPLLSFFSGRSEVSTNENARIFNIFKKLFLNNSHMREAQKTDPKTYEEVIKILENETMNL